MKSLSQYVQIGSKSSTFVPLAPLVLNAKRIVEPIFDNPLSFWCYRIFGRQSDHMFNTLEFARQKFPFLEVKEAMAVIANTELRKVQGGEELIKEGEVASFSAYIIKGIFRAYKYVDGEEKTVLFRKETEFIGAPPSMFRDKPAEETVIATEDSLILVFDWKGFKELSKKNSKVANAYSHLVEDMMLEAIDRIQDFTILTPEQRYLKFVSENKDLMNRLQLKHIASYIGITEQSLSRIRARLAKGGN